MAMSDQAKAQMRELYEAMLSRPTVLGFDEERKVGVISLVETRGGRTHLMPVAEIKHPLVLPKAISE